MTPVKKLIEIFQSQLSPFYSYEEIRHLLFILFEEYMGWSKSRLLINREYQITGQDLSKFQDALSQLQSGAPIQYILKKAWFGNLTLFVDPSVLIPRPETEELCNLIIEDRRKMNPGPHRVLDIGTGSGCIAISLKLGIPDSVVTGLDISAKALDVARINAKRYGVRIRWMNGDILSDNPMPFKIKYQIIASNPPYVTNSEKSLMQRHVTGQEPPEALYVPDHDPLIYYKAIAGFAVRQLSRYGVLYLEINERFGRETCQLLQESGFESIRLLKDFQGKERFVRAQLRQP